MDVPQPTPDYGTLGPGSDVASGAANSPAPAVKPQANAIRVGPLFAIAVGVLLAVLVGSVGKARAAWQRFAGLLSTAGTSQPISRTATTRSNARPGIATKDVNQLDRLKPQQQAETLLELAVGNSEGAVDQISADVDSWRGRLQWSPRIATLTTAALNANDLRVRASGIEVQLATYGLAKDSSSIDSLVAEAESSRHARKIWALWALGAMANRGVESERVVQVLTEHLKDSDEDSRRWAVEALALVGTSPTIVPLLRTMHDDPSPTVRERAACSLAESGMLTREQRFAAVPQLLNYSDDPALDAQTHAWAFQALHDITHQHLPNDSAAWRGWYESNN
jgi:hypothetical protein